MKKIIAVLIMSMVLLLGVVGCGKEEVSSTSTGNEANATKSEESKESEVTKIKVGVTNNAKPWGYLDEKGNLIGFDVEIIKEIDKRLDDIEVEFKSMEFSNLFISLESKKIDVISCEIEKNDSRMAKYLFCDEPYNTFPSKITVKGDRDDIKILKDLEGKTVIVAAATNQQLFMEKYNEAHNNAVNLVVSSGGSTDIVNQLIQGRADATLFTKGETDSVNENLGTDLKGVGEPVMANKVYLVLRKDDKEASALKSKLDTVIKEMVEDGTIKELSIKWLGEDYTKYLNK